MQRRCGIRAALRCGRILPHWTRRYRGLCDGLPDHTRLLFSKRIAIQFCSATKFFFQHVSSNKLMRPAQACSFGLDGKKDERWCFKTCKVIPFECTSETLVLKIISTQVWQIPSKNVMSPAAQAPVIGNPHVPLNYQTLARKVKMFRHIRSPAQRRSSSFRSGPSMQTPNGSASPMYDTRSFTPSKL